MAEHSFTATARRAQIVAAAIETIAELGYHKASFARIAERAGLSSTRLISYHFAGKDDLIEQATVSVFVEIERFLTDRMAAESTPTGTLRAYICANIEFIAEHPTEMDALASILLHGQAATSHDETRSLDALRGILLAGQESGEFRDFDTAVMALAIRRSIESYPYLAAHLDAAGYAREVATLFDQATRSQS
ncbi:MAG TPA: TetR family transcriptional regulator [Pseudonocardiaceae bacterium]|jgi:AcrR family transcriptional regulator